MKTTLQCVFLCVNFLWCMIFSASTVAATLPEVIDYVMQQHPNIRAGKAQVNAAEAQKSLSRSNFFPTLGINIQDVSSHDTQFGANLDRDARRTDAVMRWNLFRGLADRNSMIVAERDREAAGAELGDTRERVILQVTQAYIDVLRLKRLVELGQAYITDHIRLGEEVRKRVTLGRVSISEIDQVQVGLIQAESLQSQLRGQLAGAELRFVLLTGIEPSDFSDPILANETVDLGIDKSLDRLQTDNPRVRAAYMRADARAAEVGIAGGALYPTLDLELRKRLQTDISPVPVTDTKQSTMFQLNYEFPLGGASYSRKRLALEKSAAARATADAALMEAQVSLAQLWEAWSEARLIAPRLEQRVEASERTVAAYDLQYDTGKRSLNDLISARSSRYQSKSDMVTNSYTQLASYANILSFLGLLGDTLAQPYTGTLDKKP